MSENRNVSAYRAQLRERILDTAIASFAQRGIKAVKMDDIAAALSISKRTLYEVYATKEDLLFEAVKKGQQRRHDDTTRFIAEGHNVMETIIYIYRKNTETFKATNPDFYDDLEKYPKVTRYFERHKRETHQQFMDFMGRGVEEGYFRSDVNYELISHLFEALSDYMHHERLYQKYPVDEVFVNIVFVTLRGFCTNKGVLVLDRFLDTIKR